jgi:preprotein translocase subunit SecE
MIHQRKLVGVSIVLAKTRNFFEEVKTELGKVTWPTRKETVATTWVVVVIIFLISLYLGACDVLLAKLMKLILV